MATNPSNPRAALVARRRIAFSAGASGLALLMLAAAAGPVAAAPPVHARVVQGTLFVTGTPFSDAITLGVSAADPGQLRIDVGSAAATVDLATFNDIVIAAGKGDDSVKLDTANGAFTTAKPTVVFGGSGDDALFGGSGNETFFGGSGDDRVDGNGGADTAFLGSGNDAFVWDPGDGSDLVEGGSGFDTHVFNGAGGNEIMAATANGSRVKFTRNLGNIVMDLDSIEALDVNALAGTDQVTINDLTGTDMTDVTVNLAGSLGGTTPDGAADTVQVNGTAGNDTIHASADAGAVVVSGLTATVRVTHADVALDKLAIDGLGGSDIELVDGAVNGLIGFSLK